MKLWALTISTEISMKIFRQMAQKISVVSVKAGNKGNTFGLFSRICPPGWTIQIKFSPEFPRFSYNWSALYAFNSFLHERFRTWPHFESDWFGNSDIPFLSTQCMHSLWPANNIYNLFTDLGKRELYATKLVSRLPLIPLNHGKEVGIWLNECLFLDWLLGGRQQRGFDGGVHGYSRDNQLHVTCLQCSCHRQ